MKQTYGRRDRREDAIRTWLPAIVLFLGRQSEGSMVLMSKCASVLRCSGVVKRTWAIFATYVRCNRPQSTMRFWQSSNRTLPGATIGGFYVPNVKMCYCSAVFGSDQTDVGYICDVRTLQSSAEHNEILAVLPSYRPWGDNRRVLCAYGHNVLVFCVVREWSNGRGLYMRRTYAAIVCRAQRDFGIAA